MDDRSGARGKAEARTAFLLEQATMPGAAVADLLCDRHDPSIPIYREISVRGECETMSIGQLAEASRRLASALRALGIRPGDRVATLMGKGVSLVTALLAIWRTGAVHVPLFTAFARDAITLRVARSGARLIFCDGAYREKLVDCDDRRVIVLGTAGLGDHSMQALLQTRDDGLPAQGCTPGTPIIEIYTSGTTGAPKGVIVPARALAAFQAYAEFGLDLRSDDLFWNAADPGWGYGLYFGIVATLSTGTPSLIMKGGFSAERTIEALHREGVTNFAAAPTAYRAIRAEWPAGTSLRLRCASSAGEPLPPDLIDWSARMLGTPIRDHFGQTETSMIVNNHHHPLLRRALKPGSMGQAAPGWFVRVLNMDADREAASGEIGRLAILVEKSPFFWFSGYSGDAEKSREKFTSDRRWYLTGDLAALDDEGYFFFSSRDDDVILMAGYRIGPAEVEAVLEEHPAVAECAVIAAPDDLRGEVLEACIVPAHGHRRGARLAQELQQWVKERYAAHAYPRRIHWRESLPRTPSGKVQRFVLRRELAAAIKRPLDAG
ncbi:MAG TPA: AMP-binding protein [Allosphingosinicella sp.]|nr:AMP-binding protein [Allosphingosinicella sp.]